MNTRIPLFAVMIATTLALPALSRADHRNPKSRLQVATENLHASLAAFEQLACTRPLPVYERNHIRLTAQQACRLAESVQCSADIWRIRSEFAVLDSFARVIDRRLTRHCSGGHDPALVSSWRCVQNSLEDVRCLLSSQPGVPQHDLGRFRPGDFAPPTVFRPQPGVGHRAGYGGGVAGHHGISHEVHVPPQFGFDRVPPGADLSPRTHPPQNDAEQLLRLLLAALNR